ncbi:hypothetical protein [Smaragdicoccus niigatensis]|uniref:hypothetical protein n=1 Tax=Smaragdicoccus niigatensis TaxID=359359 RepID=UPI0003809E54|nr:hypothetical protein [Smaragdicoccus niigatensis]
MNERPFLASGLVLQAVGIVGVWQAWPGYASWAAATTMMVVFIIAVGLVWIGALLCLVWAVAGGVRRGLQGTVATIKVPGLSPKRPRQVFLNREA